MDLISGLKRQELPLCCSSRRFNLQVNRTGNILIYPLGGRHTRLRLEIDATEGIRPCKRQYQYGATCRSGQDGAPVDSLQSRKARARPVVNDPGCHHRQERVDGQLVTHIRVVLERLPEEIDGRPAPKYDVLAPLPFHHTPSHPKKTGPGKNAKRQTQAPDSQVIERIEMGTARPLQIPQ